MTVAAQLTLVDGAAVPLDDEGLKAFTARWNELGNVDVVVVAIIRGSRWWIVAENKNGRASAIRETPAICAEIIFESIGSKKKR